MIGGRVLEGDFWHNLTSKDFNARLCVQKTHAHRANEVGIIVSMEGGKVRGGKKTPSVQKKNPLTARLFPEWGVLAQ